MNKNNQNLSKILTEWQLNWGKTKIKIDYRNGNLDKKKTTTILIGGNDIPYGC